MNRTKNATRNIIFGIVLKVYQIIVPFLMRTAMIYFMGVEYLGLSSLFTSILQVLNLAELGVGSAMVYSIYKPIAENDEKRICALLKLYKLYYGAIGFVIALVGIGLCPFLPKLISGDIPGNVNIYILYFLNLAATVVSYWLFAYKSSLLQAHQRADVTSKITIITNTFQYGVQLLVLWLTKNYYLYIIVALFTQVITNVAIAISASYMYPSYTARGKLEKEEVRIINGRIRDLFTAKLGTVFSTSVDNMVISAFLGLTVLAVYQNYFYILNSVVGIILVVFSSCTAGIGNSLVVESAEKNYNDFRRLAFLTMWICSICISCLACLYQPFMSVWVGVEYLLPDKMIFLFCIYFYLLVVQNLSCVYKDAAGIWKKDRFRPLVAGVVNLFLNIVLVEYIGLYAIVLSTILSYLFIAMPWVIINLFKYVFKRSPKEYIVELVKGFLGSIGIAAVCFYICSYVHLKGLVGICIRLLLAGLVSNAMFIVWRRKDAYFEQSIILIEGITKHKFDKILDKFKCGGR